MDLKRLQSYPNHQLLLNALGRKYGLRPGQDIGQLSLAQSGAQLYTPTHQLLKDRDVILINPIDDSEVVVLADQEKKAQCSEVQNESPEQWLITGQSQEQYTPIKFNFTPVDYVEDSGPDVIFVPTALLEFPLKLRRWEKGDVFYPFGGPGKKKISKFFKDERLSLVRKNKTWLLQCGDRIMWVVGMRADERFRVPEACSAITKISWHSAEQPD